jgi:hypothetical protein
MNGEMWGVVRMAVISSEGLDKVEVERQLGEYKQ